MDRLKVDIERYLRGEMSPAEMHALERQAMDDPFLAEALEGIENAGAENFLVDLRELHHTVRHRMRRRRPDYLSMWNWSIGIAAGLAVIALAAVYIISGVAEKAGEPLAMNSPSAEKAIPPEESTSPVEHDSTTVTQEVQESVMESEASKETHAPPRQEERARPIRSTPARGATDDDAAEEPAAGRVTPALENLATGPLLPDSTPTIAGRVLSEEDGTALPGVTVRIKDSPIYTSTDAAGNFTLPVLDSTQALVFGFVGMEDKVVAVGGRQKLDVHLAPDLSKLSEVVVIGYADDEKSSAREYAEPAGGQNALEEYLAQELHYPEQALEHKVEGKVTIEFTVGIDGTLRDFQVLKGLGFGCDDEAIRLLKEGPRWRPSRKDSQPIAEKVKVRVKFSLPKK